MKLGGRPFEARLGQRPQPSLLRVSGRHRMAETIGSGRKARKTWPRGERQT